MARRLSALLGLALTAGGCAGAKPPEELSGLWSAGPAACEAGVGVRFGAASIAAVYDEQAEILFEHPRYEDISEEGRFRVRITYDLPRLAGGARSAGAHGVIVLAQQPGGTIAPETHTLLDPRTGAARTRLANDPATALLTLEPCGAHPWREELRGRRGA